MSAGYALLYRDDGPLHRRQAAELLAECLEKPVADVLTPVSLHWGILAAGLPEAKAHQCAHVLNAAGVPVDVLADESLVAVPERVELRKARFDPGGLTYTDHHQTHCIRWDRFAYLDVARLQADKMETHTETHTEIAFRVGGMLPKAKTVKTQVQRLNSEAELHLDVVAREPWTWLRMSLERFFYNSTGLPIRATRRENFYTLALEFAKRAPRSSIGPGYSAIAGEAPHPAEVLTDEVWRYRLRWRLSQIAAGLR